MQVKAGKQFLVFFFARSKWVSVLAISPRSWRDAATPLVSGEINIQPVTKQSVETWPKIGRVSTLPSTLTSTSPTQLQRPVTDIRSVEKIFTINALDGSQSLAVSGLEIRCRSKNNQYTAAICHQRMAGLVV